MTMAQEKNSMREYKLSLMKREDYRTIKYRKNYAPKSSGDSALFIWHITMSMAMISSLRASQPWNRKFTEWSTWGECNLAELFLTPVDVLEIQKNGVS
ncbi:hypothetical protein L208DRAFT_1412540 [Tricholoma matsutake]|nr:hypothetical protein L208DRAFT_1412540 [Tricholoma matsutake 945]